MIKRITTRGLKASDRNYELGQLNFIRGPVGSGKSQLGDAIQFAALGCVPRVGRNEAATARLMPGNEMEVAVTLGDDRSFSRTLARTGRALKSDADASWMPRGAKVTEITDEVRSLFGGSAAEAAENLDILRLLDRSGTDLAKAIEVLLDSGGLSEEDRVAGAVQIWRARIDSTRQTIDGLLQPVAPSILAALERIDGEFRSQVLASIVKAIDWAGAEKRAAANEAADLVKARAALENRLMEITAPAESAEQLKALKIELERQRTEQRTRIDMAEKAEAERQHAGASVREATEALARAQETLAEIEGLGIDPDALRTQADLIQDPEEVAPFRAQLVQPDPTWEARKAASRQLREEAAAIRFEPAPAQPTPLPVPERIDTQAEWLARHLAERALEAAKESPWAEVEDIAQQLRYIEVDIGYQAANAIARLSELAEENAPDFAALQAELEAKSEAHDQAVRLAEARQGEIEVTYEKNRAAQAEHDLALARWRETEDERAARRAALLSEADQVDAAVQVEIDRAHAAAGRANMTGMKDYEERRDARRIKVRENEAERQRLRQRAQDHERALRSARESVSAAQSRLETARARVEGITDAVAVDTQEAERQIATLTARIAQVVESLTACEQASTLRAELQSMIARIDRATANQQVYAAAEWALKRLRDEDMAARSGGLEDRMKRFLEAAGRPETPYLRCAKGAAEFGWRTPAGQEVAIEALSGGQSVLFRAALAYSIVTTRAPEVRLLLVELAEAADGDTAEALLRACGEVCDEVQVIVASCAPVTVPTESWTVIDVAHVQEVQA